METVTMARAIYTSMIVLMVLWSAALAVDLVQGLLASGVFAAPAAEQSVIQTAQSIYRSLVSELWSPAAQARAIVWAPFSRQACFSTLYPGLLTNPNWLRQPSTTSPWGWARWCWPRLPGS